MSSNYFATYVQDLEQDPFDAEDFVERLAWRLTDGGRNIQPNELHKAFEEEISNLQMISEQFQGKIVRLQNQCREEEEEYFVTLERLESENKDTMDKTIDLDARIQSVAGKVLVLGEQLSSIDGPRSRANEALQLMKHFNEFLSDQPLESDIFTDPDRLIESAEIIYKLSLVAQELPEQKFQQVRTRIEYKYREIERLMMEEFLRVHRLGNKNKLTAIAKVLSQFRNYTETLNVFFEQMQIGAYRSPDVFDDALKLVTRGEEFITEVFPNPESVLSKLVLNVFQGKLKEFVQSTLGDSPQPQDPENYLTSLAELYTKSSRLCIELSLFKIDGDKEFLDTMLRSLFSKHLDAYMTIEIKYLKDQCEASLKRFYEQKGHQKKIIQSGGLQEMKRDIQARLMSPENYGGETFLSEELAINILQETKLAFQRLQLLSPRKEMAANCVKVLEVIIQFLFDEHLDYAIELALGSIPLSEPKVPPPTHFLLVIRQVAGICHLFDKQFEDSMLPLVKDSKQKEACVSKHKMAMYLLENKMSNGLDRLLNAMSSYCKFMLSADTRKLQYASEEPLEFQASSLVCETVVKYMVDSENVLGDCLDGENLTSVLGDFGVRLHRVFVEHIYTLTVSTSGALLLLVDVGEYRKCVDRWKMSLVSHLFELLYSLCNLLVVQSNNLNESCAAGILADVDKSVVVNFVQLRADYKTARLFNTFR